MVIAGFVVVTSLIARTIERRVMKLEALAVSTRIGISKFTYFFLVGLGVLLGINAAGVDLTALTVLTGAIGFGLGFGLQAIASNFVSGFVLLMDKSIKPGDVISFTGTTGTSTENFGWVQELRGRYVVVRDRDGVETLVPNQNLITNSVINWSYSDQRVRLRLPVMISYHDDPGGGAAGAARRRCRTIRASCRSRGPVSRLMSFEDYGMRLEVRFWIARSDERRQQRALGREPRDLARVQEARHHDPGGAARAAHAGDQSTRLPASALSAVSRHRRGSRSPELDRSSSRLRPRRAERQQGRLRGAAALRSGRQRDRSTRRVKPRLRVLAGRRVTDDGDVADHRAQSPHPGRQPARGARTPCRI